MTPIMNPAAMPVISNAKRSYRDCTVVALTLLLDIPYVEAEQIMVKFGRTRKGWDKSRPDRASRFIKGLTKIVGPQVARSGTVEKFVRKHPTGKYLVWVRGHVFAVMHGIVCDHTDKPLRRIKHAFQLRETI